MNKNISDGFDQRHDVDFDHELIQVIQHQIKFSTLNLRTLDYLHGETKNLAIYPVIKGHAYRCRIQVGLEGMGILVDGGNCAPSDNIDMIQVFLSTFNLSVSDLLWINPMEFKSILDPLP